MTTLAYSHTLVAGQPENINDVQDMFGDVRTAFNGNIDATNLATSAKPATLMGAYRTVSEALFSLGSSYTAGTWIASTSSSDMLVGTASPIGQAIIPITPADYAVAGLTTQFRVQAATICNTVAPAVNFTFGLSLITGLGGGASSIAITTIGAPLATVTRAPAATASSVDSTADFTIPSVGVYVLTVALSGAPAANSNVVVVTRLQVHNI